LQSLKSFQIIFVLLITITLGCSSLEDKEETASIGHCKALMATRFTSLDDFKSLVSIRYFGESGEVTSTDNGNTSVALTYVSNGRKVISELKAGISQNDILFAKNGDFIDKANFVLESPFAIRSRKDLEKIYLLARRQANIFGFGDVAFYDLAMMSENHINTLEKAYKTRRDSSEKGYINTFNHVTAQALITTLFSEELADFIADVHELKNMPELTSGRFTEAQLKDTIQYPLDNYVDMINNEVGQELGKQLKTKYKITSSTIWTPNMLCEYLNDIQAYYMWSFDIGLRAYHPDDDRIIKFAAKINAVTSGNFDA
jgi:hypothetical protein